MQNPAYKGKWNAPLIDNPAYKGEWKPRQIPNPEHFVDDAPLYHAIDTQNFSRGGALRACGGYAR